MANLRQYNSMESTLHSINARFVTLSSEEKTRNNRILLSVLKDFVNKMREKDQLFDSLYRNMFFGGSYYDGLKVESPDEYDIDLLLRFPTTALPEITHSNKPGYVHVSLGNMIGFERLCGSWNSHLDTQKVRSWIEGVVQRVINDFPSVNWYSFDDIDEVFQYKVRKGGPAFTLCIETPLEHKRIMTVDLVPCFVFGAREWPANGFKQNPYPYLPEFFIVPKSPKSDPDYGDRYWRLSLQTQERCLINSKEKLKPALRLLKKMRDTLKHDSISSYYLKTVVMWEAHEKEAYFWQSHSLSYTFMHILIKYKECLGEENIRYFWYRRLNLLKDIGSDTLNNFCNRLTYIIRDIENNLPHNPEIIAKYLLTREEYDKLFGGTVEYEEPEVVGGCAIL